MSLKTGWTKRESTENACWRLDKGKLPPVIAHGEAQAFPRHPSQCKIFKDWRSFYSHERGTKTTGGSSGTYLCRNQDQGDEWGWEKKALQKVAVVKEETSATPYSLQKVHDLESTLCTQ